MDNFFENILTSYCKNHPFLVILAVVIFFGAFILILYLEIKKRSASQRKLLKELQDYKLLLETTINSIPEIICLKDGHGRWLISNKYHLKLFRLTGFDYQGKTGKEIADSFSFYRSDLLEGMKKDEKVWKKGEVQRSLEKIPAFGEASSIFDTIKIPIFDENGERKVMVITGRDITSYKKIEDHFRRLYENAPLSYYASDSYGRIVNVNKKWCETFGYSKKEAVGSFFGDLLLVGGNKAYDSIFNMMKDGQTTFELEMLRKDGSSLTIYYAGEILEKSVEGETLTHAILLDITAQKKAEKEVEASAKIWEKTFNAIQDVVTIQDGDMRIIKHNRAASEFFGMEELDGEKCFNVLCGINEPCANCPLNTTFDFREPAIGIVNHEKIKKQLHITSLPVLDKNGEIDFVVHVSRDVTEHLKVEAERILLATAIDQLMETVVITDVYGDIQYVNPVFERTTGYSRAEVYGKNPRILKSGQHPPEFYKTMWETLLAGDVWQGTLINKSKDEKIIEEKATISPVRDKNGNIVNFVAVKRNVSREASLERQLRQAQKMEAIGTMAGGIAHDFNNILGGILGYSEIMRQYIPKNTKALNALEQINAAALRATGLVKQILEFSRHGESEKKPIDIIPIIKEAVKMLRASIPANISIKTLFAVSSGIIVADPVQMYQIIMNLCTNAKDAMEKQKSGVLKIIITHKKGFCKDMVNHIDTVSGEYIDLEISDNGCGMDKLDISRIFDPFFTTKEIGKGTGLGLSVVHGIVKSHKGHITVDSEPGKGTTFHVLFPAASKDKNKEDKPEPDSLLRGNESIMLVDDEEMLVASLGALLDSLGYKTTTFTDPFKAFESYKYSPESFDMVITDMTMPGMSGVELSEKMLSLTPELTVIICSGFSNIMDKRSAEQSGIKHFIMKPVIFKDLAEKVRNAFDSKD